MMKPSIEALNEMGFDNEKEYRLYLRIMGSLEKEVPKETAS
jgi:hypothetical protein